MKMKRIQKRGRLKIMELVHFSFPSNLHRHSLSFFRKTSFENRTQVVLRFFLSKNNFLTFRSNSSQRNPKWLDWKNLDISKNFFDKKYLSQRECERERSKNRQTERQRNRETEKLRKRETEKQTHRQTERNSEEFRTSPFKS